MSLIYTSICLIHVMLIAMVNSSDDSCNDNEYFCAECETSCISCKNGVMSIFYKPRCAGCDCEFQWWWIPGVKFYASPKSHKVR